MAVKLITRVACCNWGYSIMPQPFKIFGGLLQPAGIIKNNMDLLAAL